jgi:RimJ/RimL family protein N-acetyltransferase
MRYIPGGAFSFEQAKEGLLAEIAHQERYGFSKWAVYIKDTGEFIGRAGFAVTESGEVEVGYGFLPAHWGKQYASETLKVLLEWAGRNIQAPEIIAFTSIENLASQRVLEKCGMKFYKQEFVYDRECNFYNYRLDKAV